MSVAPDYPSLASAREHLKDVFDVAGSGRGVLMSRRGSMAAVVNADQLRAFVARTVPAGARVFAEDGRVVALMEGEPFVAEGATIDAAIDDLVEQLREYAEDWHDRLYLAPNHEQRWGLVTLVRLSTDTQLREWIESGS